MNELDHDVLRHLGDTWGLLALCLILLVAVGINFMHGAAARAKRNAQIPLQDERDPQS